MFCCIGPSAIIRCRRLPRLLLLLLFLFRGKRGGKKGTYEILFAVAAFSGDFFFLLLRGGGNFSLNRFFPFQDMVHRLVAVAVAVVVGRVVIVIIIHRSVEVEAGARRSRKMQARTTVSRN